MGKSQDRRDTADGHFVPIGPCHPGPPRGTRTCQVLQNFGAQNLVAGAYHCRATGPWHSQNCCWCGSASAPGFAEQVIAGFLPRAGLGPAPTIKMDGFRIRRRGGAKTHPSRNQICSCRTVGRPLRSPEMDAESGFGFLWRGGYQPPASLPPGKVPQCAHWGG